MKVEEFFAVLFVTVVVIFSVVGMIHSFTGTHLDMATNRHTGQWHCSDGHYEGEDGEDKEYICTEWKKLKEQSHD